MVIPLLLVGFLLTQSPPAASARQDVDLLDSAKLGDLAHARTLVANGAPVDARDWRGYTALMWASAAGHLEMVRFLLERGAQVDSRATDGTTALILASGNGAIDLVKLLLSRGANPAATRQGTTARQLAVARGYSDVATLLEAAEALGADLLKAASEGQAMTMRQLLALGAPANTTNADGVSALMFAARNGDLGMLQYLLSRGADGSARDGQGQSVFEWAERSPSTRQQVGAFLRDRGLRPQAAAASDRTAPSVTASLQALDGLLAKAAPSTAGARRNVPPQHWRSCAPCRGGGLPSHPRTTVSTWPPTSSHSRRRSPAPISRSSSSLSRLSPTISKRSSNTA